MHYVNNAYTIKYFVQVGTIQKKKKLAVYSYIV